MSSYKQNAHATMFPSDVFIGGDLVLQDKFVLRKNKTSLYWGKNVFVSCLFAWFYLLFGKTENGK